MNLAKWLAQSVNLREKVLQMQGLLTLEGETLEGETLGVVKLGLGRLLFSTYNFNASSEKRKKSVETARLYLLFSMAERLFLNKGTYSNDLLV
jgi:hypothetical protein